jgi:curli production assembly/transport component CsgE
MNRFCLALILLLVTPFAAAAEEDEMKGFIVDDTISHIGHEFYYAFSERLRATSLVTVEYQQRLVYRRFLPPNTVDLKEEAYDAADWVRGQIVKRKLEALLQDTTDLERDEL